jgi:hydroxymethylpyrimidine/phosphomethylpyrimidine kinase
MARLIIYVMRVKPSFRAGVNFMWTPLFSGFLERYSGDKGWLYTSIDRAREPESVRSVEGMSMPWKVEELVRLSGGRMPKLFYESAGLGKEPLTVLLGDTAVNVAREAVELADRWARYIHGRKDSRD